LRRRYSWSLRRSSAAPDGIRTRTRDAMTGGRR
jgi:hypothetical protein